MSIDKDSDYYILVEFNCPINGGAFSDSILISPSNQSTAFADGEGEHLDIDVACYCCTGSHLVQLRNSSTRIFGRLPKYPQTPVNCLGPAHPEEYECFGPLIWENVSASDSLVEAIDDILAVINTKDSGFYIRPLSRMAFVQLFSALEAYLSDTLIEKIVNNRSVLENSILKIRDLKDVKVDLSSILKDPDIVDNKIKEILGGIMYHNFPKVDELWKASLGFSIFPAADIRSRMMRYQDIRHDCVHRNGKGKDGKMRADVDYHFVHQVADDIHILLNHIEDQLEPDIEQSY